MRWGLNPGSADADNTDVRSLSSLRPPARPAAVAVLVVLVLVLVALARTDAGSSPTAPDAPMDRVLTRPAVAGPVVARNVAPAATMRRSHSAYDTSSRAAVRDAYRRHLLPQLRSEPSVRPDGCAVEATPLGTRRRIIAAVNYARRMAGLDPVALDAGLSRRAQRAALIQHHLGYLTHTPARSAACFSEAGSQAAGSSNLALGYTGAATVLAYLADRGPSNRAAGHRRWLLNPTTDAMGTGQVGAANATFVVPPARLRSARNAAPAWIRWPSAGWFPAEVSPGRRWSFGTSRPGFDLSRATVRVSVGGEAVRVRRYRPQPGFGGQSALVWDLLEPIRVPRDGVRTATVTVRGMILRGRRLPAERYVVRLFHAG